MSFIKSHVFYNVIIVLLSVFYSVLFLFSIQHLSSQQKHQRKGECLYLLYFQNQVARDILEFVSFQLVSASFPSLSIYFSVLHQQPHPIAYFDCIEVELAVFLPVQMD